MRGHKFIVLLGDALSIMDMAQFSDSEIDQIVHSENACMEVITCPHENFHDNVVILVDQNDPENSHSFLRDMRGLLFYFEDHMSKRDCINAFEQTD